MDCNYDMELNKLRKVTNSWMYKYLPIFGKITKVKIFILNKLSPTAAVLPTPSQKNGKKKQHSQCNHTCSKRPFGPWIA